MRFERALSLAVVISGAALLGALGFALYHQVLLVDGFFGLWRAYDHALPSRWLSSQRLQPLNTLTGVGADLRILMAALACLLVQVVTLSLTWQRRQRLRDLITSAGAGDWCKVRASQAPTWWPEALTIASVLPVPLVAALVIRGARAQTLDLTQGLFGEPMEHDVVDRIGALVTTQWSALLSGALGSLPIFLIAPITLALALCWRARLGGIVQAARASSLDQTPGERPYREWKDNKQTLAWLLHPGPSPLLTALLAAVGWAVVGVPVAVGILLFASGPPSCRDPKSYDVCEIERVIAGPRELLLAFLSSGAGLLLLLLAIVVIVVRSPQARRRLALAPGIAASPAISPRLGAIAIALSALAAVIALGLTSSAVAENSTQRLSVAQRLPMDASGLVLDLTSTEDTELRAPRPEEKVLLSPQGVRWRDKVYTIESIARQLPQALWGSPQRVWIRCRADVPLATLDLLLKELRGRPLGARIHLTVVRAPKEHHPAFGNVSVPQVLWRTFNLGYEADLFSEVEGRCSSSHACTGDAAELDRLLDALMTTQKRTASTLGLPSSELLSGLTAAPREEWVPLGVRSGPRRHR